MKKHYFIFFFVLCCGIIDAKRNRKLFRKKQNTPHIQPTGPAQPIIRKAPKPIRQISLNTINLEKDDYVLYQPIQFNKQHLNAFFTRGFSSPRYRREVLPHDLNHMKQLIEHGISRKQQLSYSQSIIRLFHNALKSSMYLNADAFSTCIEQITPLLSSACTPIFADPAQSMKKHISDLMYSHLIDSFAQFRQDPDAVLDTISTEIAAYTTDPTALFGDISIQEFQKTLMPFLEQSLSKLVWNPKAGIESWQSVKKITLLLEDMLSQKILADDEDLNDLYTTLVERYCLFMDLNAPHLTISFYKQVRDEIAEDELSFLQLAEQEAFLEKKSERILRALMECEAKTRAQEYGIVVS